MKTLLALGLIASVATWSGTAMGAVVFSEDFDTQATSSGTVLNFTGFNQFSVTSGTVDLLLSPGFGITCTIGCVDLDGSNINLSPGTLTSDIINFVAGVNYELSYSISGNQRNSNTDPDTVLVGINNSVLANASHTLNFDDGFMTFASLFSVVADTTGSIVFAHQGQTDFQGIVLDSVKIENDVAAIPLPAALPLLAGGLGLLGLLGRRKKRNAAA